MTATAAGRGAFARHVAMLQEIIAASGGNIGTETPLHNGYSAVRSPCGEGAFCATEAASHPRIWLHVMNILLLGSGGREHALAWKIAASPLLTKLWCAPGNAGIAREAECVALDIANHAAVIEFCKRNAVDLVVVGPETPLAAGIVDDLAQAGIKAFGPGKQAAQLEGSKGFTKALCTEFGIPTGAYGRFTTADDALAYVRTQGAPIVVKADGLAAGKGVVVAQTLA